MTTRINIDNYFLKIAAVVAERSTCLRHHVGAIAVLDRHIISTGYNGAPAGLESCLELGCLREEQKIKSGTMTEICRAVHAEENSIIQAALHGRGVRGCTIYCTHSPCVRCTKMLINSEIHRYVTYTKYADDQFIQLFKDAEIEYDMLDRPNEIISFKD